MWTNQMLTTLLGEFVMFSVSFYISNFFPFTRLVRTVTNGMFFKGNVHVKIMWIRIK